MENKKTKLTISGNPKKSFKNFDSNKSKGKKTVIIDKQKSGHTNKGSFLNNLHLNHLHLVLKKKKILNQVLCQKYLQPQQTLRDVN